MSESSPSEKTATGLPDSVLDRYVRVGNIRTHYLEAGNSGPTVVLLHSAEYGARASFSWFANIEFLAQDFRVVAPDMVGFGYTDKLHSFTDQWMLRVQHIRDFLETLCIEDAHFVGSSYAGGLIQRVGLMEPAPWPIRSITSIGGGGAFPDSPARRKLFGYDGTLESYRDMMRVLCDDPYWHADDVVMERWQASVEPGAWEALSAPRLAMPGAQAPPPLLSQPCKTYESRRSSLRAIEMNCERQRRNELLLRKSPMLNSTFCLPRNTIPTMNAPLHSTR